MTPRAIPRLPRPAPRRHYAERRAVDVAILRALVDRSATAPELAEQLGRLESVVRRALHRLRAAGRVQRFGHLGPVRGRRPIRWRLA